MHVLVLDANNRVALAVVRALGNRKWHITVAEQKPFAGKFPSAFYSRYAQRRVVFPPLAQEDDFLRALQNLRGVIDILVPVSTNTLLFCTTHRTTLQSWGMSLWLDEEEKVRRVNNKEWLMSFASQHGIRTPRTHRPHSPQEITELLPQLRFPFVIKLVDDKGLYLTPGERYAVVSHPSKLSNSYKRLHALKPFPLIQEYIEGDGYGFSALAENGETRAFFCHKRLREFPPSGGPSTLCVSIYDDKLVEMGEALLQALQWTGVAMIEFKKDRRTGEYVLMELNPRFWGTLPLATACGVNFPHLWCLASRGEKTPPQADYPRGIKMQFRSTDIWAALASQNGQRLANFADFVRHCFNPAVREGVLELVDWRASVAYLLGRIL